jgi:DNA polymerase III subunit epsilon
MREIVFDTETTGFGVEEHRIIEIGCVEMINRLPSGRTFHKYLNPEREIDFGATKVHGITNEKVADAPLFKDVVHEMLEFFGDAPLVAHNAEFDFSFMNKELERLGMPPLMNEMVDTLVIARQKLPGQRHNLDSLCKFYDIDTSARVFHGALLDAQLLADVYVELHGGLQAGFELGTVVTEGEGAADAVAHMFDDALAKLATTTRAVQATPEEIEAHKAFLQKCVPNSKWLQEPKTEA